MPANGARAAAASSSASRLWTTTGSPSSSASASCASKRRRCCCRRREAADRVEAGLADRDRLRMREQLAKLVEPLGLRLRRLMRVDAERRVDAVVALGDRERSAARLDPGADGDDPRDAGLRVRARRASLRARRTRRGARARRSRRGGGFHPRELLGDDELGVELREERRRLAQRLPGGKRARLPAAGPDS